jgi:hypothetical protein
VVHIHAKLKARITLNSTPGPVTSSTGDEKRADGCSKHKPNAQQGISHGAVRGGLSTLLILGLCVAPTTAVGVPEEGEPLPRAARPEAAYLNDASKDGATRDVRTPF